MAKRTRSTQDWDQISFEQDNEPANTGSFAGLRMVGGVYNGTAPTYASGDAFQLQGDVNGNVKVTLATTIAGEDLTNNVQKVEQRFNYHNMVAAGTTTIKGSAGFLHSITVNTTTAAAIGVYNSAGTSASTIATLKASVAENTYTYDVEFGTALTVACAGTPNITISYR